MKFVAGVELQPSGAFGLPEGDRVIVPGGQLTIASAPINSSSMVQVGHGTLSRFRDDEKAIRKNLRILDLTCVLLDNVLNITLKADRGSEAYDKIVDALDRFVKHLILTAGQLFSYRILFINGEDGVPYRLPTRFTMDVTAYNLDRLASNIEEAERMVAVRDSILDRALQYYDHAMFLFEKGRKLRTSYLNTFVI